MRFLHTMIRVKDIDASLKFYTEVLDMTLDHKKRLDDCWLYFLNDKDNTCQIELTYNDETPDGGYEIGNGFGHFAFAVESMDEFTKKIEKLVNLELQFLLQQLQFQKKSNININKINNKRQ